MVWEVNQPAEKVGVINEKLEEKWDLFPDKSGHSLGDVVNTILIQFFWAKVLEKTEKIGIPFCNWSLHGALSLNLLLNFLLSAFFFADIFLNEQIS